MIGNDGPAFQPTAVNIAEHYIGAALACSKAASDEHYRAVRSGRILAEETIPTSSARRCEPFSVSSLMRYVRISYVDPVLFEMRNISAGPLTLGTDGRDGR